MPSSKVAPAPPASETAQLFSSKLEEAEHSFKSIDRDGNGLLTMDELVAAVPLSGAKPWPKQRLQYVVHKFDRDGDSKLDLGEFTQLLSYLERGSLVHDELEEVWGRLEALEAGDAETENERLRKRVAALEAENARLKAQQQPMAEPAAKPNDTAEQAALRAKVGAALKPLQQAKQTQEKGHKHALPESLQSFTTLAEEPAIIEVVDPLQALEAAVAREPDSKEAAAALDAALKKLVEVMRAKIEERTAGMQGFENLFHPGTTCEKSGQSPIVGYRYNWYDNEWHDLCEAEYQKLPDDEKAKFSLPGNYHKIAPTASKLLQDIEATIAAGNRDFERVYCAVWAVLQSGEEHLFQRFKEAVTTLLERIKKPGTKPGQREEAKEPTTLLVDAVRAKPSFEVIVEELATSVSGAKLEMVRVGAKDRHGKETSGLKKLQRVVEKALLKPVGDATVGETDSVLDVVRAMIVVKDFGVLAAIVDGLKTLSDAELVDVLRLKNRFKEPSPGGWRDLMVNLVILSDERRHVCEIQIVHEMMLTARKGLPGHAVYNKVRTAQELVERLGKERELRLETVRKVRAAGGGASDLQVIAAFEDGWLISDAEWAQAAGNNAVQLAEKCEVNEEGRVVGLNLAESTLKELPASVGRLKALQTVNLYYCTNLTSLPAELGQCMALTELALCECSVLTSLPDLSGLEKLEVTDLPEMLNPWEEQGRKAFALPITYSEDAWLLTDAEWAQCASPILVQVMADEEGRVVEMDLSHCEDMEELPASVGRLKALTKLNLQGCSGLTSLPAELNQLVALTELALNECYGLTSLPDLSGLEKLEIKGVAHQLPQALKTWEERGRKAFALPTEA